MKRVVAVLEVQWGPYPTPYFRINPYNFSGARLIKLVGHGNFYVTNACPGVVATAKGRGKPCAAWLAGNLARLQPAVVLVCGRVARATFKRSMVGKAAKVLYLPHPAARTWTKQAIKRTSKRIQRIINSH